MIKRILILMILSVVIFPVFGQESGDQYGPIPIGRVYTIVKATELENFDGETDKNMDHVAKGHQIIIIGDLMQIKVNPTLNLKIIEQVGKKITDDGANFALGSIEYKTIDIKSKRKINVYFTDISYEVSEEQMGKYSDIVLEMSGYCVRFAVKFDRLIYAD